VHGDVRNAGDLETVGSGVDLLVDASAEPSVLAGVDGSPRYVIDTNLGGTVNCLELARRCDAAFIFLSTSRVYSIAPLRGISLREAETRFDAEPDQESVGVGPEGVAEEFPTHLPRSLYGATKLASELLIQEYVHSYGLRAIVNRCGVIAGAGQFGKVDQGVFTLWVAHHFFGKPLTYTGFGGTGKQVRDLLHPHDLYDLIRRQVQGIAGAAGETFNVGGGARVSTSLLELTAHCQEIVGRAVPVDARPETSDVDIPWFVTDARRAGSAFGWRPHYSVEDIVRDIFAWIETNQAELRPILG
jgi:CDP-paratose 2-epimerase